jgi:exportin-2 (importin alpha re-exporter)
LNVIDFISFSDSDEELFEDNPEEYIRKDIEGSDIDTRRRACSDFLRTLSTHFEAKIIELFGGYLNMLLERYKADPKNNWRSKDTAIYLVTTLASKGATQKHGVTQASSLVPIPQFLQSDILPELERPDINEIPVLKADALKFLMTFRTVLGAQVGAAIPLIVRHLESNSYVVHSYAACNLDKMLIMKDAAGNPLITQEVLAPHASAVVGGLFNALDKPNSGENEYVMKAIMRSFSTLNEHTMPFMAVALPKLTEILALVAKNPSKPHFNHYLFETIALSIKIVCKIEPNAVSSFEEALFPQFQHILQTDIMEFLPYVFQMLSLLMEIRQTSGSAIPEPYLGLFPHLLSPILWERPGNITPLIRLLCTFIKQASPQIQAQGKLMAVLGVFQKMIASKSNDHEGFYLLQSLLTYYPREDLVQNMASIFTLLFQRLSSSKTTKYVKSLIVFFTFYAAKIGPNDLIQLVDGIQNEMFGMVCNRVFIPDINKVSGETERKIVAIGIARILCESQIMLQKYVGNWQGLLQALIELFELPCDESTIDGDTFVEIEDTAGYQVAYSQLNFASTRKDDPFADIPDGKRFLMEQLNKLNNPQVKSLMTQMPAHHQTALQKYSAQYGVSLF